MAPLDVKPNELEPYWIPFTANRAFKKRPRLFAGAKGMHYFKPDGAKVLDATSGLFCVNAGHCREPIDTALKIALAYHKAKGQGARTRFIGRERGYHGIGFGGISVGGLVANRKQFGNMLTGVDHL